MNRDKISQIAPCTSQEKPAQVLKYVIERLVEVSTSKEFFIQSLEGAFGTRLFNKTKDKVVKKVIFNFILMALYVCIFLVKERHRFTQNNMDRRTTI